MLKLANIISAERVVVDKDSNKVTVVDVVENLKASQFPLVFSRFCCLLYFSRVEKDPEIFKYDFLLKSNDKIVLDAKVDLDFQGSLTTRSIVNINGLAIPSPGIVKVVISSGGKILNCYEFITELDANLTSGS